MRIGEAKANSRFKIHGSTPMSVIQMVGDKSKQTDSHSLLAKDLGLWPDRQLAKTLNFLMLFFGGSKGLIEAIKTARPDLTEQECSALAKKALKSRKGIRDRNTGLYKGGTDSEAYNKMMNMASTPENRTILGNSAISYPLQKQYCGTEFMPSRCNRGIQSAGVDILHVFTSILEYLYRRHNVTGKFIIAIHDEVWTIVREDQAKLAAWLFQLSHMLTWSIFYEAYGFNTIPFNYLFFSSVNVDVCLRKEVTNNTLRDGTYIGLETPSNVGPEVEQGYSISPQGLANMV